jgi:CubicO group peptidase (beta-lactamase class C family)
MIDMQRLEEQIQAYIRPDCILGMAIAIVHGESVLYSQGFGVTSIEDGGLPVTPKTVFAIGSTSKTINAMMIMRLVEQGILDLDKAVIYYLPGYVFTDNPGWGERVTLRHLLSHTSGLTCGGKAWGPRDPDALRRWVGEEMAHFAFIAEPGRVPYYANGPSLAGHVAEAVTGKNYAQLVEEQIFAPLGMKRTTYDRRVAMTFPLAMPHAQDEKGNLFTVHLYADNPAGNPEGFCLSTAEDLTNLLIVLLNQGRISAKQFLSAESVATMQVKHGDYQTGTANDVRAAMMRYEGLGLSIGTYKGVPTVGHSGMLQGMMTMFDLFPAQGLGVVSLVNYCDLEKRNEMLFALYDQLLDTPATYHFPAPETLPGDAHKALWPQYEGVYLSPSGGLATVAIQNGALTVSTAEETYSLNAVTAEQYTLEDSAGHRSSVTFSPEASGPTQLLMLQWDLYQRITISPDFTHDPARLSVYEGLYANYIEGAIIDGFYVRLKEGMLIIYPAEHHGTLIAVDKKYENICTPLSATRFASGSGLYDFALAPDGGVAYVRKDLAFRYYPVKPGA